MSHRLRAIPGWAAKRGVLFIDAILIRLYGVETFTDDPTCILRASLRRVDRQVMLADGTVLYVGDKLIELHFWNEHLPVIGDEGADIPWGRQFIGQLIHSLRLLAAWAGTDPRCAECVAAHGQVTFMPRDSVDSMRGLAGRFGFILEFRTAPGMRFWTGACWAGLYSWWLMWAYNHNTLRRKRLRDMALSDIWMTRDMLTNRYGKGSGGPSPPGAYAKAEAGKRV